MLAFWDVGICQPQLNQGQQFILYKSLIKSCWAQISVLKVVTFYSLLSWQSHKLEVSPACHIKEQGQQCLGLSVFLTSPLHCCDPGFVCCLAVKNYLWTLLCSVASSPLSGSHGRVCSTACWTLLRKCFSHGFLAKYFLCFGSCSYCSS